MTSGDGASRAGRGLPRWFEAPAAALALVVCAPILGLAALAVAMGSGRPVLFRQSRVGRGGRLFTLVKLRTMRAATAGQPVTATDDPRITRVGRLLRRSKLDELPELWNVLRGDMAFVGPRPEVPELVDRTNPLWSEVLEVRPGLTDPVTIRFRNEEAILAAAEDAQRLYREVLQPQKLRGYREYLRRRTWRSDLRVIWDTARVIVSPRRANLYERTPGA